MGMLNGKTATAKHLGNMSSVLGRSDFDPTISNALKRGRDPENVTLLSEGVHAPSKEKEQPHF
eukprot:6367777-Amphidinium_carterae.1